MTAQTPPNPPAARERRPAKDLAATSLVASFVDSTMSEGASDDMLMMYLFIGDKDIVGKGM